jgi:hypothetical protein
MKTSVAARLLACIALVAQGLGFDAWAQASRTADLIIAVDTSGSMNEEVSEFQSSLNSIVASVQSHGIDLHVILIADLSVCMPAPLGTCTPGVPDDSWLPNYRHVLLPVKSTNALVQITTSYRDWVGSLRAGASRSILVLTDDNSSISAAGFESNLLVLSPDFASYRFHGIVADTSSGLCQSGQQNGEVYIELAARTGGTITNLCDGPDQVSLGLQAIAESIVAAHPEVPPRPVANAGADTFVAERTGMALDGSASDDPSGGLLSYEWTQTAPVSPVIALDVTDPARPRFTAPEVPAHTVFTFRLVVSTPLAGASAPDFVNITVVDSGQVPAASGCQSTIGTIAALNTAVAELTTARATLNMLKLTLQTAESALTKGYNRTARLTLSVFLNEVVIASNLSSTSPGGIDAAAAGNLICGGAGVLNSIAP